MAEIFVKPKIVESPVDADAITKGKKYSVIACLPPSPNYGCFFTIKDDKGDIVGCIEKNCSIINKNDWIIIEKG